MGGIKKNTRYNIMPVWCIIIMNRTPLTFDHTDMELLSKRVKTVHTIASVIIKRGVGPFLPIISKTHDVVRGPGFGGSIT